MRGRRQELRKIQLDMVSIFKTLFFRRYFQSIQLKGVSLSLKIMSGVKHYNYITLQETF